MGRVKSTSVCGVPRVGGGTQPLPTELTERVERLHRRPPFRLRVDHRDPEDRTGRRPNDLGIVGVDRSGTEERLPPRRPLRRCAASVPRLPGSASAERDHDQAVAGQRRAVDDGQRRDRQHRLRRAGGAHLLEHAFLQRRPAATPDAASRAHERRGRRPRPADRGRPSRTPAPRSSAASIARGPSTTNAPVGGAGPRVAQQLAEPL